MRHLLFIVLCVVVGAALVALVFAYVQAGQERIFLSSELQYRTALLADSLKGSVEPAYVDRSEQKLQKIVTAFSGRENLIGVVVFDETGKSVASSPNVPQGLIDHLPLVGVVAARNKPIGEFISNQGEFYILAEPIAEEQMHRGIFLLVQDATYIDASVKDVWMRNLFTVFAYLVLFALAIIAIFRWVLLRPLVSLVESIRVSRASGHNGFPQLQGHSLFFRPLAVEIAKLAHNLTEARSAASEEARMRLEKIDTPWTAERLREFVKAYLKGRPIFVVSNREPYVHYREKKEIRYSVPAHGMVTAVESVMEACGGLWLAQGSGDADKEMVDAEDKVHVPPDEPRYTLKRVWLSENDVKGFYTGFSNEALFPLCLMSHTRPIFRKEDWTTYGRVNGMFAKSLLWEIRAVSQPIVLVQDLHFALLPRTVKKSRPDAQVGLFWHHPWPSAEQFSICPWKRELLEGMLGADVIGFHTQQHCNNFIETVRKEVESLIDLESFTITREGHVSHIRAFPVSIAFSGAQGPPVRQDVSALQKLGIHSEYIGLGVDRLDYTKGILERFRGIELFLDSHSEYLGRFTFLQVASPSRESVQKYREYSESVKAEAHRINEKFKTNLWRPIVFERRHYSHAQLRPLFQAAHLSLVTSLHDGMNLVAKEYVAARDDEMGVLVLSRFTGAAKELEKGALLVNPYNAEEISDAIHAALLMTSAEQCRRMKIMRSAVKDYNVYRWAAELMKAVASAQ